VTDTRADPGRSGARAWVAVVAWSVVGTVLAVGLVLFDLARTREVNGFLIHTGPGGPAAELFARDFPDEPQFERGEHDGVMFYAVARDPADLDRVAESLDRPRYRLQRPLYPLLARALLPFGEGEPLVWAMFVVGVLGAFGGAVSLGFLSVTLRGPPWLGVLFPILPGVLQSLRISVADGLAVALMLGATAVFLRGRLWPATALAVAAVLAKEPVLLTFVGLVVWSRRVRDLPLVVVPASVAAALFVALRLRLPDSGQEVIEFGAPLRGWWDAVRMLWLDGAEALALVCAVALVALSAVVLLRRRPSHPLWWPLVANLVLLAFLNITVVGLDRNGPRTVLAALVLAVAAVAGPGPSPAPRTVTASASAAGTPAPGGGR